MPKSWKAMIALLVVGICWQDKSSWAQDYKEVLIPSNRLKSAELKARPDYRAQGKIEGDVWAIDRRADGTAIHYWKGEKYATSTSKIKGDVQHAKLSDGKEEVCATYRNPKGTNEDLNEFIAVCDHGTFPYALLPMPAAPSANTARNDLKENLSALMKLSKPEEPGQFPAVMMLSGCSGFGFGGGTFYNDVQDRITKLGFLVIRVDSLRHRGHSRCDGGVVTPSEQVADIQLATAYLQQRQDTKKDAINVVGWSWGGGGSLAAAIFGKGINAVVAYYPFCKFLPKAAVEVPTLILQGEADDVVNIADCKAIISKSKVLTLHTYANAHHSFDVPAASPPRQYRFGTLGYDKSAADAAWRELVKFLRK
jgi:dienelactone hydrolase